MHCTTCNWKKKNKKKFNEKKTACIYVLEYCEALQTKFFWYFSVYSTHFNSVFLVFFFSLYNENNSSVALVNLIELEKEEKDEETDTCTHGDKQMTGSKYALQFPLAACLKWTNWKMTKVWFDPLEHFLCIFPAFFSITIQHWKNINNEDDALFTIQFCILCKCITYEGRICGVRSFLYLFFSLRIIGNHKRYVIICSNIRYIDWWYDAIKFVLTHTGWPVYSMISNAFIGFGSDTKHRHFQSRFRTEACRMRETAHLYK